MGQGRSAASPGLWGSSQLELFLWLPRGEKYGFITYRYSEHAALSLKNGPSLRKRNEPSFQLSSGGLGRFFWTRFTDLGEEAAAALSLFISTELLQRTAPLSPGHVGIPNAFRACRKSPLAFLWLVELLVAQTGGLANWGEAKKAGVRPQGVLAAKCSITARSCRVSAERSPSCVC